ncbi:MAG: tRNA uridine-5-carboxymethylaminomethyl(34) synthesis GTPase MnmE, partial [Prevotella sp.]|nr:tRNA uridine-5-carboxymethylaminomethyl(34) synthesis GTPase MnmE [Prevotella sp.]
TNISQLEQALYTAANIPEINENSVIVTSARHYEALTHANESITRVIDAMEADLSGDLISEDLRICLEQLSEITGGQITPNEVLGNIFQHFCIGK